jgi:hypothetical protein
MSNKEPSKIFGAWIATKDEILAINRKAKMHGWGACFKETNLERIMDEDAHHLVVPLLTNHPDSESRSYRCTVWLKVAEKNVRLATLMDFGLSDIESLERPPEEGLHGIIAMLLEHLQLVNLDRYRLDEYKKNVEAKDVFDPATNRDSENST